MNIIEIKTGQFYDPEYSEYHFKTNQPKREFYDENFNLTQRFLKWLEKNHNFIYQSYIEDREHFEILYIHDDNIELIP